MTYRSLFDALGEAATVALTMTSCGEIQALVREVETLLNQLGEAAGIPIVTPTHRRLSQMAARHGLAAKPCGAGGGDLSLVFGEPDALRALHRQLAAADMIAVPLRTSMRGVESR